MSVKTKHVCLRKDERGMPTTGELDEMWMRVTKLSADPFILLPIFTVTHG